MNSLIGAGASIAGLMILHQPYDLPSFICGVILVIFGGVTLGKSFSDMLERM